MIEIIIITFNRMSSLSRTLNAIKDSELAELKITVLDNCSDDGTAQMLEDLVREGSLQLHHVRNSTNIGPCANLMRAYEIATEDYLWVLCDDDEYNFTTFSDVIAVIQNDVPDVIVVGSPNNATAEQLFPNKTGTLLRAHELGETDLLRLLTFLPSAIINTRKLKCCDFRVGYDLSHTFFPQFFWISEVENEDWSVFVAPNLMVIRSPVEHGLDSDFTHINGYLRGCDLLRTNDRIEHMRALYFGSGLLIYAVFIAKVIIKGKLSGNLKVRSYLEHLLLLDARRMFFCALMWFIFFTPNSLLSAVNGAVKRARV